MTTRQSLIESLVKEHGERARKLIVDALAWLDAESPKWKAAGLKTPLNKRKFIAGLVSKAVWDDADPSPDSAASCHPGPATEPRPRQP